MGDLSAEPSMEEILSSIKRIIAEEGEGASPRPRRPSRPAPHSPVAPSIAPPPLPVDEDHVLELSDPMPAPRPEPARPAPERSTAPERAAAPRIVSPDAAAASRGSLEALSRMRVKPEPGSDGTLEGMVRDMVRPMLRDWLDAHLPEMVEQMVAREIERISQQG